MTDNNFFREEICDGFLVSSTMKKVWHVELELLKDFIRVCEKYHLHYYAEGGTLIGVIRHGGFIPWDDDIDIAMPRKDYDRLLEVGPKEFSHPHFFQTPYTDKYSIRGYTQIRNSNTTALARYDRKGQNQGIFIDIFPMDNIPDEEAELRSFLKKITLLKKLLNNRFQFEKYEGKTIITYIRHFIIMLLFVLIPPLFVYKRFEKLTMRYSKTDTLRSGLLSYDHDNAKLFRDNKDYVSFIMMPFQGIELMVPIGYDNILRTHYGDYRTPVRELNDHGEIIFDPTVSYIDYIQNKIADKRDDEKKLL